MPKCPAMSGPPAPVRPLTPPALRTPGSAEGPPLRQAQARRREASREAGREAAVAARCAPRCRPCVPAPPLGHGGAARLARPPGPLRAGAGPRRPRTGALRDQPARGGVGRRALPGGAQFRLVQLQVSGSMEGPGACRGGVGQGRGPPCPPSALSGEAPGDAYESLPQDQ